MRTQTGKKLPTNSLHLYRFDRANANERSVEAQWFVYNRMQPQDVMDSVHYGHGAAMRHGSTAIVQHECDPAETQCVMELNLRHRFRL